MNRTIALLLISVAVTACANPEPINQPAHLYPVTAYAPPSAVKTVRAQLYASGGTPHVKVQIDNVCCFDFTVDSGAADVSVSPAIFKALVDSGRTTRAHLIDVQYYRTAGGTTKGLRFRLPPLTINGVTVDNVIGSVTPGIHMMLLGQSFLRQFKSWQIDNDAGQLVLTY